MDGLVVMPMLIDIWRELHINGMLSYLYYIDFNYISKGIGKKLYLTLIKLLKLQGVKTVYAGVTVPK